MAQAITLEIQTAPKDYFYLSSGQIIKNIEELAQILSRLDDGTFYSHVNQYKNDFAKWIYEVFRNEELSEKLGPVKNKDETIRILNAFVMQKKTLEQNISIETKKTQEVKETLSAPLPTQKTQAQTEPQINLQQKEDSKKPIEQLKKEPTLETKTIIPQGKKEPEINNSQAPIQPANIQNPKPVSPPEKIPIARGINDQESKAKKIMEDLQNSLSQKAPVNPVQSQAQQAGQNNQGTMPVKQETENQKKQELSKITDPDIYFEKNPVLISNLIDAKKRALEIEPIPIINYSGNESPQQLIEVFKDNYSITYQRLSFLRKSGFYTSLVEMMLFRIPPKIKVYESTKTDKDALLVKRYLNEAIEELNSIKK